MPQEINPLSRVRTFLFTPGDQPNRIKKALTSSADAVVIDLEDAVRIEKKIQVRHSVNQLFEVFKQDQRPKVIIRTNQLNSDFFANDLELAFNIKADAIMIPKFISGDFEIELNKKLAKLEKDFGLNVQMPIIGLVESVAGVLSLIRSPLFTSRVQALAFGAADFAADSGILGEVIETNLLFAQAVIVMASVEASLTPPIASPHFDINDELGLRSTSERAFSMGFGGRLCIHPNQLQIVTESFEYSDADKEWAASVVAKWSEQESGAFLVGTSLIDQAMVKQAKKIIALIQS